MLKQGNCLDLIKEIEDNSIDAVITDPPYKQEARGGGIATKIKIYKEMSSYTALDVSFFKEPSFLLQEFMRICKFPNFFIWCGKKELYDILSFAVKNKLIYYIIPVCKRNPVPFTNNTWLSGEFAVHITDRKLVYCTDYETKKPYFITDNSKVTKHPNEKNIKDVAKVIKNITREGDLVLDPFMGSGTTLLMAKQLKRNYIGFEKEERYFNMANKRVNGIVEIK